MIDTRRFSIFTFGDSVLDSGRYSGTTPGEIVARARNAKLGHFAQDGATTLALDTQWERARLGVEPDDIALVSVGGNDFMQNPMGAVTPLVARLSTLIDNLTRAKANVFVANIYDPTFGNDANDPLGIPWNMREAVRRNFVLLNNAIHFAAQRATLVDLHAHFLRGDPSWYASIIEPSARGAEEVAKAFMAKM